MVIALYGPPGSGKGTQAELLARALDAVIVCPGVELRKLAFKGSLDAEALDIMNRGDLVDERVTTFVVEKKLASAKPGQTIIFDGYPRSMEQVHILDRILKDAGFELDAFVFIKVSESAIIKRVSSRRVCSVCGHIAAASEVNCVVCGGELTRRTDDELLPLSERILVFETNAEPLLKHFKKIGKLIEVDGEGDVQEIFHDIKRALSIDDHDKE